MTVITELYDNTSDYAASQSARRSGDAAGAGVMAGGARAGAVVMWLLCFNVAERGHSVSTCFPPDRTN